MRYIATLIFTLFAMVLQAQQMELKYSKLTDPFRWTVSWIETNPTSTRVSVSVKNTAFDTRVISFSQGEFAYYGSIPKGAGIKATSNSHRFNSNAKNVSLRHNDEISFILTFPTGKLGAGNVFSLRLGTHFTLNDISIPELSLADINRQMQTWEQYYNAHKKAKLTYRNIEEVKRAIQLDVENWQKKGEFESTLVWQTRVNEKTRQQYIADVTLKFSTQHERELNQIKREQVELAENYETYKQSLLDKYYQHKIARATNTFIGSDFELKPYDADNETFLIHSKTYGDILLPVPVNEAPSFKQNWATICNNIKPEFVPNGENVALNKLVFTNNYKKYAYDSHTVANYAITDVNYNFAPVEIAEINFADIEIDGVSAIPNNVSSSIVRLNNHGGLAQNNFTPTRNKISASDKSDVDISIPQNTELKNSTTFAVIIANEKYNSVSPVPYAENDGIILSKYLINTVGLPKEHVKIYNNATFGNMAAALKHINNLSLAFGEKLNLILYYAGHGVPNEQTKQCMLLPIDGDATMPETCYDVEKLYNTLGKYNANSIIVMMDACFSGSIRGNGMLFASRSVKIKSNQAEPKGNMVIFSASQGDETAYPFDKEQHGMFTYYLLKNLQESKGNVTLGKLSEYLIEQVKRQSVVSNGKLQTPAVQVGELVKDVWMDWKFGR